MRVALFKSGTSGHASFDAFEQVVFVGGEVVAFEVNVVETMSMLGERFL